MTVPSILSAESLRRLSVGEWHALADDAVRHLLAEFIPLTHASEIAIWIKDPLAEQLVALIDTSGSERGFELKITQALSSGIVSQVFRDQQPFLDRGLWRSAKRSPLVDAAMNQVTQNEMCVPFAVAGQAVGVMSAVQLTDARHVEPSRWGFDASDLKILSVAAMALGLALERSLLRR